MDDTHPAAREQQDRLYRAMGVERRVELAFELSRMADDAALAGILERWPDCSPREARLRLAVRKYGTELVARAYGWREPERSA